MIRCSILGKGMSSCIPKQQTTQNLKWADQLLSGTFQNRLNQKAKGAHEVVEKRHRGRCYSYISALFRIHHCLHFSLGIRILHFEKKNSQLFKISLFEKVTSNIYSRSHQKLPSVKEETVLSDQKPNPSHCRTVISFVFTRSRRRLRSAKPSKYTLT